jgi:hypothetical protein
MVRASSAFVGFFSTSLPRQMTTGVSDDLTPNLSSKAPAASGSSSSSTQTWSSRLRAANSLRRVASLERREPIILRPKPALIPHERLAIKALRMMSERLGSWVTTSFSRSRGIASTSPPSRITAEGTTAWPVSMVRSPTKRPARRIPIVSESPAKSSITSTSPSRTTMKALERSPALIKISPTSVLLVFP